MLKFFVSTILSLSFFAQPAHGQSNPAGANAAELPAANSSSSSAANTAASSVSAIASSGSNAAAALKLAAQRESLTDGSVETFRQSLEQVGIAHMVAERRAQLRRDTDKLVALTAELKQHVEKSGPDILSMDVIKKAAEIQKLAKSVEDKMKNAY